MYKEVSRYKQHTFALQETTNHGEIDKKSLKNQCFLPLIHDDSSVHVLISIEPYLQDKLAYLLVLLPFHPLPFHKKYIFLTRKRKDDGNAIIFDLFLGLVLRIYEREAIRGHQFFLKQISR